MGSIPSCCLAGSNVGFEDDVEVRAYNEHAPAAALAEKSRTYEVHMGSRIRLPSALGSLQSVPAPPTEEGGDAACTTGQLATTLLQGLPGWAMGDLAPTVAAFGASAADDAVAARGGTGAATKPGMTGPLSKQGSVAKPGMTGPLAPKPQLHRRLQQ
mmetsp:Transcript_57214/g.147162  ORF Transcript_57214/g.147162 Transcript_57214/m.147162 type:complete len:157 (+) Transcript_57214:134-604(+)